MACCSPVSCAFVDPQLLLDSELIARLCLPQVTVSELRRIADCAWPSPFARLQPELRPQMLFPLPATLVHVSQYSCRLAPMPVPQKHKSLLEMIVSKTSLVCALAVCKDCFDYYLLCVLSTSLHSFHLSIVFVAVVQLSNLL